MRPDYRIQKTEKCRDENFFRTAQGRENLLLMNAQAIVGA